MQQYKGAVFFIDLLGTGALTQKKVKLTAQDYEAWSLKSEANANEHLFCATLLVKFRTCLAEVHERHPAVKVAQLSDCAFIWSKDVTEVLETAQEMMWAFVRAGLFCRGGIAYGEIIEPEKVRKTLGQFVLGEAVSRAVGLEGAGKGCRVFSDDSLPSHIFGKSHKSGFDPQTFDYLKNPLDGSVVDEFKWYIQGTPGKADVSDKEKVCGLLELISLLRYSPLFSWNASTSAGRIQLACSIESISSATAAITKHQDYVFNSEYMINGFGTRTKSHQEKILSLWLREIEELFTVRKRSRQTQSG